MAAGDPGAGRRVAVLVRRRAGLAPYAVLTVPVLFLTFGPAADRALQRALERVGLPHDLEPYRLLFDGVSFLQLQRVTARMLVLAALLLLRARRLLGPLLRDGLRTPYHQLQDQRRPGPRAAGGHSG